MQINKTLLGIALGLALHAIQQKPIPESEEPKTPVEPEQK